MADEIDGEEIESEWEFYLCLIEDQNASILVDLSYQDDDRGEGWEHLVRLRIALLNPRDDGLCTPEENELLNAIDDALFDAVGQADGAIAHVGRVTWGGFRDFFFYAEDTVATEQALSAAMVPYSDYEFEIVCDHDPDWSAYYEILFPSPREMQMIMNERVLRSLAEHGDNPEIPRDISHWIFFPSDAERQDFATRASQRGYRVVEETGDGDESPLTVVVARAQTTDRASVHDAVLELFDLAEECDGEYDGWETSIEGAPDDDIRATQDQDDEDQDDED